MEPTTGLEPVNLFLTKEVLYLLSYVGSWGRYNGYFRTPLTMFRRCKWIDAP